jgi:hypothetical protein
MRGPRLALESPYPMASGASESGLILGIADGLSIAALMVASGILPVIRSEPPFYAVSL